MSLARQPERLELPLSLQSQLHGFRRRLWAIKMTEAIAAAAFGVVMALLAVFALDRLFDTPVWVRLVAFLGAWCAFFVAPLFFHRWIWRHRRPEQIARLLSRKLPQVGDQLLGVIELSDSSTEQARSRALCVAAIGQVAADAGRRDLSVALPNSRYRMWCGLAVASLLLVALLAAACPEALSNAWTRFSSPWGSAPRYTFVDAEALPDQVVVAHGEPFALTIKLRSSTRWSPATGRITIGGQPAIVSELGDQGYRFGLPPQIEPGTLSVRIGDYQQRVGLRPELRPELSSIVAQVELPDYLELPESRRMDVRGGAVALVKGSRATFTALATRDLESAQVDGQTVDPSGNEVASPQVGVDQSSVMVFQWRDHFGLEGQDPFSLTINARDDEAPDLICEDLPRRRVVLDSEQLTFNIAARDDFGVKQVGMHWRGFPDAANGHPAEGERVLASGASDQQRLDVPGAFTAQYLKIEPQPIELRLYVEDYLPGRDRVYSAPYLLYVLSAEQHAIWMTEQLSKWHRQSLEVRDRELQLYETNKQLRELSADELDRPETRRQVEAQSAAERANGRRLANLTELGEELVLQASRNPEFGVGHLERWAEMLQILKDISGNRMPSVADLLKEAAKSEALAASQSGNQASPPTVGQVRDAAGGKPSSESDEPQPDKPTVPSIVDIESGQQPPGEDAASEPQKKNPSSPRLTLPTTTLIGRGGQGDPSPAQEKVEQALQEQRDLLAEFEKVADELNTILGNLEGSTLVKRLKAASREQYQVAGRIGEQLDGAFGRGATQIEASSLELFGELANVEHRGSYKVSTIMDDMQAYFERRRLMQFKVVLDDMKQQDVVGSLRQLGSDLQRELGLSIAQCEYWSDTMDRWAEDLVDPACKGTCPGSKSKGSLPPSIILEVMQILEAEINLREDTRIAERAKDALPENEFQRTARELSEIQETISNRIVRVIDRIAELPDAESEFAMELALLERVLEVMDEAATILDRPETGAPAIAAETEAIELLLQSRRINPKGGGGGGANPGGGGGGTTVDSALALLGKGVNEKEVREDHGVAQAVGDAGPTLPEEFRAGLDEYFNRLDQDAR